jgi:NADPH:quinone reductase-like Zn-dependent oxidoreductase
VKGLQIAEYGKPADVVKLVEIPEVGAPGPDEIVIDVVASSIEPTDLYMAEGIYAYLPHIDRQQDELYMPDVNLSIDRRTLAALGPR